MRKRGRRPTSWVAKMDDDDGDDVVDRRWGLMRYHKLKEGEKGWRRGPGGESSERRESKYTSKRTVRVVKSWNCYDTIFIER